MVPLDDDLKSTQGFAEDWLVACTIATEVPPAPVQNPNSQEAFTAPMIMVAEQAVAEVILNRVKAGFAKTASGVVLAPKQFSGTLRGLQAPKTRDIWADAVAGLWFPQHVAECLAAWRRVVEAGRTAHDIWIVPGALYYYSPVTMEPPMSAPAWAGVKTPVTCLAQLSTDYFRFYR